MICALTIIVLTATTAVLGWLVSKEKQAIDAQKTGLEATRATVEALKEQSDLKFEPMKETISSKDAAIHALEAQLSAAVERKALAEEKMSASQEHLNELLASLPAEMIRRIQAEVETERMSTTRTAGTMFFNFGYYLGVMGVSKFASRIQSLAFARVEKKNLSASDYAIGVAVEYLRDSVLFFQRERRVAFERFVEFARSRGGVKMPDVMIEQLERLYSADKMMRNSGIVMSSEVDALSSMQGFPLEP